MQKSMKFIIHTPNKDSLAISLCARPDTAQGPDGYQFPNFSRPILVYK